MASTIDLLERFQHTLKKLERSHAGEIELLRTQIKRLQDDNVRLRTFQEQHPHAAFSIDHVSTNQFQHQLDQAHEQMKILHETLNQKCSDYEDLKSKYQLQRLMNENTQKTTTIESNREKELENQLKQIKDQVQQFVLSHDETDEQIRLLQQLISGNSSQNKGTNIGLMVKQSDLAQQTTIVESILNQQHEKILSKIVELLGTTRSDKQPTLNHTIGAKTTKKKRL